MERQAGHSFYGVPCDTYDGFSDGTPISKCRLKKPHELLALKICDPAMGSGAFLVQVCRWLGARLVESWEIEENSNEKLLIDIQGNAVKTLGGKEKMSVEPNERLIDRPPIGPLELPIGPDRHQAAFRCDWQAWKHRRHRTGDPDIQGRLYSPYSRSDFTK